MTIVPTAEAIPVTTAQIGHEDEPRTLFQGRTVPIREHAQ